MQPPLLPPLRLAARHHHVKEDLVADASEDHFDIFAAIRGILDGDECFNVAVGEEALTAADAAPPPPARAGGHRRDGRVGH